MIKPSKGNSFFIEKWHAWVPLEGQAIAANFTSPYISLEKPDFSFIPAMTRRRLSFLTKISLFVADKSFDAEHTEASQIIFASRHGELQNSLKLLYAIAKEETISPALFSLSVHNAAAGIYSILSKNTSPHCFVAAGNDTMLASIVEALGALENNETEKVLLVIADDELPQEYKEFVSHDIGAYAMGFSLNKKGLGTEMLLENISTQHDDTTTALELISFLADSKKSAFGFPGSGFVLKRVAQ